MNIKKIGAALEANLMAQSGSLRLAELAYRKLADNLGTGKLSEVKDALGMLADSCAIQSTALKNLSDAYGSQSITVKSEIDIGPRGDGS